MAWTSADIYSTVTTIYNIDSMACQKAHYLQMDASYKLHYNFSPEFVTEYDLIMTRLFIN
jgi:hypothetical protein